MLAIKTCILFALAIAALAVEMPYTFYDGSRLQGIAHGLHFFGITCSEPNENHEKSCKMYRKSLLLKNEQNICYIKVGNKSKFKFQALAKDKAAVTWFDVDKKGLIFSLRNAVVNFPDCKIVEMNINFDESKSAIDSLLKFGRNILINDDGIFDVFFEDAKLCGGKACMQTFDVQGRELDEPVGFYKTASPLFSVVTVNWYSPNKTYVLNEIVYSSQYLGPEKSEISLIKPDSQQVLSSIPTVKYPYLQNYLYHDVSATYGTIRVCRCDESRLKINCETFDVDANSLSKTTVESDYEIEEIKVYNLPNTEFILVIKVNNGKQPFMTKVGADGKRIGTLELTESLGCNYEEYYPDEQSSEFQVINGEYCQGVACVHSFSQSLNLKYIQQCYTNDDFK